MALARYNILKLDLDDGLNQIYRWERPQVDRLLVRIQIQNDLDHLDQLEESSEDNSLQGKTEETGDLAEQAEGCYLKTTDFKHIKYSCTKGG